MALLLVSSLSLTIEKSLSYLSWNSLPKPSAPSAGAIAWVGSEMTSSSSVADGSALLFLRGLLWDQLLDVAFGYHLGFRRGDFLI